MSGRWKSMYYAYAQPSSHRQRIMTVIGEGKLSIAPDMVQIQLEVTTGNEQLSEAQQENAHVMHQVIESLLGLGIARENIKTTSFNIHAQYDYIEGRQIFRGYEVTNAILVTLTDIAQAGNVIDTAVQNGVNRVSNIQFLVENESSHYQRALRLALLDAFAKAKTIAETMHVKLDPTPIKITEEMEGGPIAFRTSFVTEQQMSTPIEPGQLSINAIVNVQFQY